MEEVYTRAIEEVESDHGGRLGRHVEHDPRSKDWAWEETAQIAPVTHNRHGSIFNQGNIGSCTGNASAGATNCDPFFTTRSKECIVTSPEGEAKWLPGRSVTETNAKVTYSAATVLDGYPGTWPPDDTGSSGLAVAKVLNKAGLISSYRHAFSTEQALQALQTYPFIFGTDWYEGFDEPDDNGLVEISGQIRGGHEIVCRELAKAGSSMDDWLLWFDNSWAKSWGYDGRFCMTVKTFTTLLGNDGDVTILVP
jgi:hypothetical protein